MREIIAIAFAVCLGIFVGDKSSSYNLESEIQKTLRPVAIHINRTQSTTPSEQRKTILSKLIDAQNTTTNHYTRLGLQKLIIKVQLIIDNDLDTAPAASVVNALADIYLN